ncbi:hypothetical protein [Companilactobacillus metriopterae]|uniref:hypothetical protein n=1 Tax=Companilactobacillus metriopterae TaxID=1909267 RepID=UPI00100C2B8A|nr:hypothetical protein [Companilactobacillus metriopterae]
MKLFNRFLNYDLEDEETSPTKEKETATNSDVTAKTTDNEVKNDTTQEAEPEKIAGSTLEEQRMNITQKMGSLAQEYSSLKKDLKSNLFSEYDKLVEQKETFESYLKRLKKDTKKDQEYLDELENYSEEEHQEKIDLEKKNQEYAAARLFELKDQQHEASIAISKAEVELSELHQNLAQNQQDELNLSSSIKEEANLQKLMELMEEQKNSIDTIYKARKDIQKSIDEKSKNLTQLNQNLEEVSKELTAQAKNVGDLENKVTIMQNNFEKNKASRASDIAHYQGNISNLEKETEKISSEIEKVDSKIDTVAEYIKDTFNTRHLIRDIDINSSKNYFLFADSISEKDDFDQHIRTIKFIEGQTNKSAVSVTTSYNRHIVEKISQSMDNSNLPKPIILNMYADLQSVDVVAAKNFILEVHDDWTVTTEDNRELVYDATNSLIMEATYKNGIIQELKEFRENTLIKTSLYNMAGILSSEIIYNNGKIKEQNYYKMDGQKALAEIYNDGNISLFQVFDGNDEVKEAFENKESLIAWWLETVEFIEDTTFVTTFGDLMFEVINSNFQLNNENIIVIVKNVNDDIGVLNKLLNDKKYITDILVENTTDLKKIEQSIKHDITVSLIEENLNNSDLLPDKLEII